MNRKNDSLFSLEMYMRWPLIMAVLIVLLNFIVFLADVRAGMMMLIATVCIAAASLIIFFYSRKRLYSGLIEYAQSFEKAESVMLNEMGTAAAIVDTAGNVLWKNDAFSLTFNDGDTSHIQNIFPDMGKDVTDKLTEASLLHSSYGEGRYLIEMRPAVFGAGIEKAEGKHLIFITVTDETELVRYKNAYEQSRSCEGLIYLDNYDEALNSVEEVRRSLLMALVDRRISGYISSLNGIVKKLEKDKYFFFMKEKDVDRMIEDKFSILEDVKTINIGNDMDITLSIGVGRGGTEYNDNYESARSAIEFALGRGGDQAVLQDGENVTFFGGKSEAKEKHARVKARVKAQALRDLLNTCDKLIIMGHKNADVDCLGAAVGFWKIATTFGKKAWIVMGRPTRSLKPLYDKFIESSAYPEDMFISGDEAMEKLDDQTVVAVVDVNRPSITEEPRLLKKARTITVVDHHRKTTEAIENAVLTYVEPYASSACELISEIIQYMGVDIDLTPLEADAMYGGMVIDTQNFVNQTGVRTFEAAAFLRRSGANTTRVRKMFRESYNDYRAKAETIDRAEIYREHFAFSVCNAELADSPTVIGAQSANSLLEMEGMKAAIVLTPYNGQIYVSARSIDDVNVQVMMEKIGGGGHMSVAGAQLKDMTVEEAEEKIKAVIDQMLEQGDIS